MDFISNIPDTLKQSALWCVWERDTKGKIPYNPRTGHRAKSNDPATFSDFETAYNTYQTGQYSGLGIGIFNGIGAIDIDHCIDNNQFSNMASDVIHCMESYTEISPSGNGVHIVFTVDNFQYNKDIYYINNHNKGLEVYISGATNKFITITGNKLNDNSMVDGTPKLMEILDKYMKKSTPQFTAVSSSSSNNYVPDFLKIGLEKDNKLKAYWNGARPHGNESEDDAGLMAKLLYWCNNDTDKAIKAFLSSPYASQKDDEHKQKLERHDYLPNLAQGMRSERTAIQDNEEWQENHTINQKSKGAVSKQLKIISAPDLQKADFPPTKFLVDQILPEGTSMIAAAPKTGKSFFVLLLGLKIAAGEKFLQWQTHQVGVLYLSFEDTMKRLQNRMNKLLNHAPAPLWFYFSTEIISLDDGLLESISDHIKEHPETKLIIIDTFQKIRGQGLHGERWYEHDYREAGAIKEAMDKKGISVLFVHHTSKTKDKEDPFNEITGTNGISGVMDTIFVIKKSSRNSPQAKLYITGRDVEQDEIAIRFNGNTCEWEYIGDADELEKREAKFEYQASPIVKTIKVLLNQSPKKQWTGIAKEILEAGEKIFHIPIATSSQKLSSELIKLRDLLYDQDKIVYKISPNGNAGHRHHFYYDVETLLDKIPDNINF
jgi:hypothetical protein